MVHAISTLEKSIAKHEEEKQRLNTLPAAVAEAKQKAEATAVRFQNAMERLILLEAQSNAIHEQRQLQLRARLLFLDELDRAADKLYASLESLKP
jgi:hypothetical protein